MSNGDSFPEECSRDERVDKDSSVNRQDDIDALLRDPTKKAALLRRIGLDDTPRAMGESSHSTPSGKSMGGWGSGHSHSTPSGKSMGGWGGYPSVPFWPFPYPGFPPFPNWGFPGSQAAPRNPPPAQEGPPPLEVDTNSCISSPLLRKRLQEVEDDEDSVQLLDDAEALELVEFDPSVEPKDSWSPPQAMLSFLEKHFNQSLEDVEREAILKDFPKPLCKALLAPRLDDQVKEQLKRKGRDPSFGGEKSLFRIQDQLLDVAGPLTCLWADLLNKDAGVTPEDMLLLVQRALVLVGSVSHSITLERRKIAWSRINPKLKSLASEDYKERESNLFGPGFLEKASKRLEVEKTLEKVSNEGKPGPRPPQKRPRYDRDTSDLRSFLAKGASARCGGSKTGCQYNPHSSYTKFRNKYFTSPSKNSTVRSVELREKPK